MYISYILYILYILNAEGFLVIARLLQNLAYLHPLDGHNGRSRLLLLQYELRRNKLACGTMMFNNNKNAYFDTLDAFTAKILEGIRVYNEAGGPCTGRVTIAQMGPQK